MLQSIPFSPHVPRWLSSLKCVRCSSCAYANSGLRPTKTDEEVECEIFNVSSASSLLTRTLLIAVQELALNETSLPQICFEHALTVLGPVKDILSKSSGVLRTHGIDI